MDSIPCNWVGGEGKDKRLVTVAWRTDPRAQLWLTRGGKRLPGAPQLRLSLWLSRGSPDLPLTMKRLWTCHLSTLSAGGSPHSLSQVAFKAAPMATKLPTDVHVGRKQPATPEGHLIPVTCCRIGDRIRANHRTAPRANCRF